MGPKQETSLLMSRRSKAIQTKVPWSLKLLGNAQVLKGKQPPLVLDRKPAAVLAYLALEGPTPRPKLAGLLWPDSGEEVARTNLRKLLQRLRENVGDEVLDVIGNNENRIICANSGCGKPF